MKLPYEIIDYIYSFDDNRFLIKTYNLCMCELKERFGVYKNNYDTILQSIEFISSQYERTCDVHGYNRNQLFLISWNKYVFKYIKKMKYIRDVELNNKNSVLLQHLQYYKVSPSV
tara:strand:- start:569 stop:913 length:345 start_codon:yes stop_codon:yes gene_type:complete